TRRAVRAGHRDRGQRRRRGRPALPARGPGDRLAGRPVARDRHRRGARVRPGRPDQGGRRRGDRPWGVRRLPRPGTGAAPASPRRGRCLRRSMSDPLDVLGEDDPVRAVLRAERTGRRLLLRTGGTTRVPRSVTRSPASWFDSFPAYGDLAGIGPGAVVAVLGPMTATMNLFAGVQAHWAGARLTADPADASHVVATPAQLHALLDSAALRAGTVAIVA